MSVYLANFGRMCELLLPIDRMLLREAGASWKRTHYDLITVYSGEKPVVVDSRVANSLIFEALKLSELDELARYLTIKPEHVYGHSLFDFLLYTTSKQYLLEVKSCILVKNNVALFPDVPTKRGQKHLSTS